MQSKLITDLLSHYREKEGHIFYHFNNSEAYLANVVTFIKAGLQNGAHILLVENDRNMLEINKKLKLTNEELLRVHFLNNYDFYFTNKTFEPKVIFNHFIKQIGSYIEANMPVWTWGNIEWRDDMEIIPKIEVYESNLDKFISGKNVISVCAYDVNSTSKQLEEILVRCHSAMLTDDEATLRA